MKKRALFFLLAVMLAVPAMLGGCNRTSSHQGGQLTIGSDVPLSGDWGCQQWTNNTSDQLILDLTEGYSLIARTRTGEPVYDETVASITETEETDGTKTFAVDLAQDLKWNDGTPVTAKDYVAKILLFSSWVIRELGAAGDYGLAFSGYDAFTKWDGPMYPFRGVRLLGEYRFSVNVRLGLVPYYFEKTYLDITPLACDMWLPADVEISDEGSGAHFNRNFTPGNCQGRIEAARSQRLNRLSCGPYRLESCDLSAGEAVLTVNEYYKGDYQGQKPNIETIYYRYVPSESICGALENGGIDLILRLTESGAVRDAMALAEKGGFGCTTYPRNGYNRLLFQCDAGPTQFVNVRKALAHLVDRASLAETSCGGTAAVINGPYCTDSWMYKESADELNQTIDPYAYDPAAAVRLLVEDGWVLNETGGAYTEGIRYKRVPSTRAGTFRHNVKLADGTILMPLIIEWASAASGAAHNVLADYLSDNAEMQKAGMQIQQTEMPFSELRNWFCRDVSQGLHYGAKRYGIFNLAAALPTDYDRSYCYSSDEESLAEGINENYISDDSLNTLSIRMTWAVEPGDREAYRQKWLDFIVRWNQVLPDLPLYVNTCCDAYSSKLKNWDADSFWGAPQALLYAWVEEPRRMALPLF